MRPVNHKLSKRYARALLSLALEYDAAARCDNDMKLLVTDLSSHKELLTLLKSPLVRISKKIRMMDLLFKNRVDPLTLSYIRLVVRKQRGAILTLIAEAYRIAYKAHMGIETVRITTADELTDQIREKAMAVAAGMTDLEIEFEESVDADIIGGFVLTFGETRYDASLRSRLRQVRKHLQID